MAGVEGGLFQRDAEGIGAILAELHENGLAEQVAAKEHANMDQAVAFRLVARVRSWALGRRGREIVALPCAIVARSRTTRPLARASTVI